jgi:ATP adenylyltransferase
VDRLWSPWRLEYVTSADRKSGCIFCLAADAPAAAAEAQQQKALIVYEGLTSYVILNRYPYNNGHLMVVPLRHVGSLAALTADELQEVGTLTQRCETVLTEAYQPHGMNVGINLGKPAGAGVLDHLHVHLVPRWNGDTNFMSVVGNVRVVPEEPSATLERLRPIFEHLDGQ